MADLNFGAIEQFAGGKAETSIALGQPRLWALAQYRNSIMEDHPAEAALLDVHQNISSYNKGFIERVFNTGSKQKTSTTDQYSPDQTAVKVQITNALNRHLPGTFQDVRLKNAHYALVEKLIRAMPLYGDEGHYSDISNALPKVMGMLYGHVKVFNTSGPVKLALPKDIVNYYNVGQTELDESLGFTISKAHQRYGDTLSLIAREGAEDAYGFDPVQIEKGEDFLKSTNIGTNRYNERWNKIMKKAIVKDGGNIWMERINDPDDPESIRLVVMSGNPDYKDSYKIIGDLFGVDKNGNSVPVTFSAEETVKMMASRQAWQKMDSDDDFWDGQYWDWGTSFARFIGTMMGAGEDKHISTGEQRNRWSEAGGDFSRENIDYYHNRFSKDVNKAAYDELPPNSYGGKYFTEWFKPGRVELDMYIDPLWKQIQILEKSKSEELGKPYTINNEEYAQLFYLIKNGLNGTPGWFSNKTPITYFDTFFANQPQETPVLQSIFEAMHD